MTTDLRTTLNLDTDLAQLVEDYWYEMRLSSRNAAIRELLRIALETEGVERMLAHAKEQRR